MLVVTNKRSSKKDSKEKKSSDRPISNEGVIREFQKRSRHFFRQVKDRQTFQKPPHRKKRNARSTRIRKDSAAYELGIKKGEIKVDQYGRQRKKGGKR